MSRSESQNGPLVIPALTQWQCCQFTANRLKCKSQQTAGSYSLSIIWPSFKPIYMHINGSQGDTHPAKKLNEHHSRFIIAQIGEVLFDLFCPADCALIDHIIKSNYRAADALAIHPAMHHASQYNTAIILIISREFFP